jgi:hypothetical protein
MFVFGIPLSRVVRHYIYISHNAVTHDYGRHLVGRHFVSFVHQSSYKQSHFPSHRRLLLDQPPALKLDRLPFQVVPADRARSGRWGWHRLGLDLKRPSFPASLPRLPPPITDQQQHANEHDKDDGQDDKPQVQRSARTVIPSCIPIDSILRAKVGGDMHVHREHGCGKGVRFGLIDQSLTIPSRRHGIALTCNQDHGHVANGNTRERENQVGNVASHDSACHVQVRHVSRLAM